MGEAKRRGTFEQRKTAAINKRNAEFDAARQAYLERQREREARKLEAQRQQAEKEREQAAELAAEKRSAAAKKGAETRRRNRMSLGGLAAIAMAVSGGITGTK